ncbi:MAG: hypothetical protein ACOYMW_16295 [Candidatus Competibacteraceae bacterium]
MHNANDILRTGVPRSGTTLACALLNRLPNAVALIEPMPVHELANDANPADRRTRIARFCAEQRHSIQQDGTAIACTAGDGQDDNTFGPKKDAAGLRRSIITRTLIAINKPLPADFLLIIKHPNAFTAILEHPGHAFSLLRHHSRTAGGAGLLEYPAYSPAHRPRPRRRSA